MRKTLNISLCDPCVKLKITEITDNAEGEKKLHMA